MERGTKGIVFASGSCWLYSKTTVRSDGQTVQMRSVA